ncbi:MAG: YajD family HNH nuclease [Proteobacteria bacterium]|nr:YajD family HNH nuclease [Pseudomonadota bacterium]MBU1688312.1 YajD family HNH nuclease [Pseudomonadota bacterium]
MNSKHLEYRNQALKILPWVCAKCGREFSGKKLQELTVHHKDHNYKNNPPDGSNWELLCIYCHDNEHSRALEAQWQSGPNQDGVNKTEVTHSPFAALGKMLQKPHRPTEDND